MISTIYLTFENICISGLKNIFVLIFYFLTFENCSFSEQDIHNMI